MRGRWARSAGHLGWIAGMALVGTVLGVYVVLHERFNNPTVSTYTVNATLPAAPGVQPGFGQPVTVSGVSVGTITGMRLVNGQAQVTLTIKRSELPRVYRDATALLRPITPLGDMELMLDPGHPAAGIVASGGTLPVAQGSAPAQFEDLLSALDTDTRDFLTQLISSLDIGTQGRALDIRAFFRALGPTTAQAQEIATALAGRRIELARLVHNLAVVLDASTHDRQLATVVAAGNTTLQAIARQEAPLRTAIAELPSTMSATRSMLSDTTRLADVSGPALKALTPPVRQLPAVFSALRPFAGQVSSVLKQDIRPFTVQTQPLLRNAAPALTGLSTMTPHLQRVFQVLEYLMNEMAYNPNNEQQGQGYLFWLSWMAHNLDSWFATQDANGGLGRSTVLISCAQISAAGNGFGVILSKIFNLGSVCNRESQGVGH